MAREVCTVSIHSYRRFGVSIAVTGVRWCMVWPVCTVVCAAVCTVVRGAVCVVCAVESIPTVVALHTSCVNTYEGCLERPAVLKEEDIPILKQTAIHP